MRVLMPRTVINASIPYVLRERLTQMAQETGGTLSGAVAKVIAAYFEEQDRQAKRASKKVRP